MKATTRQPPVGMEDEVIFLEAGPAGTRLCPADHSTRTMLTISRTQGEGDRPQVTPISRKEECSTDWDHRT